MRIEFFHSRSFTINAVDFPSQNMMTANENHQRNLLLPVSRIPNEILSRIFCNLRNSLVRGAKSRQRKNGLKCLKGWINITYVCHSWREVALNTPLLWCHIDLSLPLRNWIPELVRRSKQCPLTVVVERTAYEDGLLEGVKNHLGRTRELVLDDPGVDTLHEVLSPRSNVQNLERLDIDIDSFFLNPYHLRRHPTYHSCSIDWKSKLSQSLTHLRLENIPHGCRLGCRDFLLVLSKIPALKTLHLFNSLHEDENDKEAQNHPDVQVHLRHLQLLCVKSQVPEMARFLPALVVPHSCKLHLETWKDYDAICDEFRVILSWISNQFRESSLPTSDARDDEQQYIKSVHFIHNPEMVDFKVEAFCDVLSHEQLKTADPILKFVVPWVYDDDDFDFNLRTFFSLLPLGGVTFLDVVTDLDVDLSPEFWMVAFGSIETLKSIYLDTRTSTFWEALNPTNDDKETVKCLPFSALASITVEDHDLDSQLILDNLRARSELGVERLQDLRFSSNGLVPPESLIIQLRELVSHVQIMGTGDVDGNTIDSGSDSDIESD